MKHESVRPAQRRQKPDVFNFGDFRALLLAFAQEQKENNSQWSFSQWARQLGLKGTASLTMMIKGQREPGPKMIQKLTSYFKFSAQEAQYFADLVRLHKVKQDARLTVLLLEKMRDDYPEGAIHLMDHRSFALISNWYGLVLREMVCMAGFSDDPHWIKKKLRFDVSVHEIKEALDGLTRLGLIQKDKGGSLRVTSARIATPQDVSDEAIKRHHEQMLDRARQSLRSVDVSEREITSATFVMDASRLAEAKDLIRKMRSQFTKTFEKDGGDTVFQFQMQLFPMTSIEMTHITKTKEEV